MDLNQHMPIFIKSTVNVFKEMLDLSISSGQVENESEGIMAIKLKPPITLTFHVVPFIIVSGN